MINDGLSPQRPGPHLNVSLKGVNKINTKNLDGSFKSIGEKSASLGSTGQPEPRLICNEKELPANIEEEIKSGFFELK